MEFALETAVEYVLGGLHEQSHEQRCIAIEAASQLEKIAEEWRLKGVDAR
jgi:hypothetical protein